MCVHAGDRPVKVQVARQISRADEMLTAFLELQGSVHEFAVTLIS